MLVVRATVALVQVVALNTERVVVLASDISADAFTLMLAMGPVPASNVNPKPMMAT